MEREETDQPKGFHSLADDTFGVLAERYVMAFYLEAQEPFAKIDEINPELISKAVVEAINAKPGGIAQAENVAWLMFGIDTPETDYRFGWVVDYLNNLCGQGVLFQSGNNRYQVPKATTAEPGTAPEPAALKRAEDIDEQLRKIRQVGQNSRNFQRRHGQQRRR